DNEYVDLLAGYGALVLGHSHPAIVQAVQQQVQSGTMLGTTTQLEVEVAKKILTMVPSADMVSFANTGTEATMEAIRIARAYTGRDKILKFEGHYHGHHDYVLFSVESPSVVAGLEQAPSKLPYYPGIPEEISNTVVVAPWNDPAMLERALKRHANDLAAIIMEPVMGSAGIIPPKDDYLKVARELADKYDVLLIFDEVLTGFRISPGGAAEFYGVKPDLACYAKALGGGTPIAAVAGRRDIMGMIGPGKIGYGGTYNANSMCLAAANATLNELQRNDGAAFKHMHFVGAEITQGLRDLMERYDQDGLVKGIGPMFQLYFTEATKITNYRDTLRSDFEKFRDFRNLMLHRGVYLHPDGSERMMITAAHDENDVDWILGAAEDSFRELQKTN
ncbi:MAG TPA: aspartate aminotransferase family protein, partial [Candidatus Bathyarchaeia archaeon]|nr:aspartate aminotransferase family protein [Candidatus Bathyarchaeia archaeon]